MTKNMYLALFCLALLFGGCGFFISVIQKDEMQKNIDMFLLRHRLQNNVVYNGTSFSLTAPTGLKNITLKNTPELSFDNTTDALTIHAFEDKNGLPVSLSASATGIRFKLSDLTLSMLDSPDDFAQTLARFNPATDMLTAPVTAMLLAGCDAVNADVHIDYAYSETTRKMYLKTSVADACLGRLSATVGLSGIASDFVKDTVTAAKHFLQGKETVFPVETFLQNAVVTAFSLDYTEGRLVNGYKRYIDTLYLRLPGQTTAANARYVQSIASYLSFFSVHKQRNMEIARTIAAFIDTPKTISFSAKNGKDVPLKALQGDIVRRMVDFLVRADVNVTTP